MQYHLKHLKKRGENTWEACYYYTDPITNERKYLYHTIEAQTKKAALRLRDEYRIELEMQGVSNTPRKTVAQLLDEYVDYKNRSCTIEKSTVKDYRYSATFVKKFIGHIQIGDLTSDDVNEMMAQALEEGYKPKSVCKPFRLLKQALKHAVMRDILPKNVCDFCQPPRRGHDKPHSLDRSERLRMMRIARLAQPQRLALAIEIALTTGMRRGEVAGLRWSDFDPEGTITVKRAIATCDGGYYVKCPKTGKERTIPLSSETTKLLRDIRDEQVRDYKRLGMKAPDSYILGTCEPDSKPYCIDLITKEFSAFAKMNGFECTFHDLRHTFATMMIANGTDVRTVSSYLGHASPSMTLDVYADVDPDAKRAAVSKIDQEFSAAYAEEGARLIGEQFDVAPVPMASSPLLAQQPEKAPNPALDLLMSESSSEMPTEVLRYLLEEARKLA